MRIYYGNNSLNAVDLSVRHRRCHLFVMYSKQFPCTKKQETTAACHHKRLLFLYVIRRAVIPLEQTSDPMRADAQAFASICQALWLEHISSLRPNGTCIR